MSTDPGGRRLDPLLEERLHAIGLEADALGDPAEAWRRLRRRFGGRITLVDRYALEAAHLGMVPGELPLHVRERLGAEVLEIQFPGIEFVAGSGRSVRDPIRVVPYDPAWARRFAALRRRLADELGDTALRIQHVGSTAVRGLAAKPVVDVQISVRDTEDEGAYVAGVERVAAELRMREPGHRYFRPAGDRPRDVQVHVCDAGSKWEREHLLFRDYLHAHPAARDAYAELKQQLATRYPDDRLAYTDAKSAFILDALDAAREWADATGWDLPPERIADG